MSAPTTGSSPPPPSPPDGASAPPASATSTASPASTSSASASAVPLRRQRPLLINKRSMHGPGHPTRALCHLVTEAVARYKRDPSGPCRTRSTAGPAEVSVASLHG